MPAVQRGASCVGTATEPYISAESVTRCALLRHSLLCLVLSLIFLEKPFLDILAAPQLLGLFKIVVGRLPELFLCKRITRCSRARIEVVRHFAKFGDRRHASFFTRRRRVPLCAKSIINDKSCSRRIPMTCSSVNRLGFMSIPLPRQWTLLIFGGDSGAQVTRPYRSRGLTEMVRGPKREGRR
jgi:hypothetical protein